jgi:hypothetical protein
MVKSVGRAGREGSLRKTSTETEAVLHRSLLPGP